ncbi:hypothetical protein [Kitasatospora cineracea]|uniref:hypothetical protein n=1 Tax=Kitasatospora cineracea TaxID=88074 RepID=UPI003692E044
MFVNGDVHGGIHLNPPPSDPGHRATTGRSDSVQDGAAEDAEEWSGGGRFAAGAFCGGTALAGIVRTLGSAGDLGREGGAAVLSQVPLGLGAICVVVVGSAYAALGAAQVLLSWSRSALCSADASGPGPGLAVAGHTRVAVMAARCALRSAGLASLLAVPFGWLPFGRSVVVQARAVGQDVTALLAGGRDGSGAR